tara:strand:+ start:3748 stop:4380 length:633 start_codon:yes stop_codon:yes gene_type:complete
MQYTGAYIQFEKYINKVDVKTILELGTRYGVDTIYLQSFFNADVVSFECNPEALNHCRKLLSENQNIKLVEKAVWSENKTMKFYPVTNGNIGASSAFKANSKYPYEQYEQSIVEVDAVRLDDWWKDNQTENIDLICMDIQGSELEALKGMGDLLKNVKYIITECQYKRLYKDTPLVDDLDEYLSSFGFVCREIQDANDWFGDAIFINVNL